MVKLLCLFRHAWTRAHVMVEMYANRAAYRRDVLSGVVSSRNTRYIDVHMGGQLWKYARCRRCRDVRFEEPSKDWKVEVREAMERRTLRFSDALSRQLAAIFW